MSTTKEIGDQGESEALQRLCSSGAPWKLLVKNYRCRMGEIDLIGEEKLEDGSLDLVFVEVRVRRDGGWVDGIESVDPKKRRRLVLAAQRFLMGYQGFATGIRFDILAWDGQHWTHLKSAYDQ